MSSEVRIENVIKRFPIAGSDDLLVLNSLDFSVKPGSLLALLGPSGCGKSTLLNIVMGLDEVTDGRIMIDGKELKKGRSSGITIGTVFQQARLLNWRTVAGNVMLPLEELDIPKQEKKERVERYLELVGLKEFADYYPLQLSGGMQQRVAVARGLVIEPDLLLADEPFSSLDEITARKLREEFIRIWQETGRTVIFVTHNIREAVYLSSQLVMVTPRPASVHVNEHIDIPYPRDFEDERLFDIERRITRTLIKMEEEAA